MKNVIILEHFIDREELRKNKLKKRRAITMQVN